jgi:mRNA interferase RelE/StbE
VYRLEVEPQARKALARLPGADQGRIVAAIDDLAAEPRPAGSVPVKDAPKGTHRIRIGDFRVIYLVLDSDPVIIVARVARRNESTYWDAD